MSLTAAIHMPGLDERIGSDSSTYIIFVILVLVSFFAIFN